MAIDKHIEEKIAQWVEAKILDPKIADQLIAYEKMEKIRSQRTLMMAIGVPLVLFSCIWPMFNQMLEAPDEALKKIDLFAVIVMMTGFFAFAVTKIKADRATVKLAILVFAGGSLALANLVIDRDISAYSALMPWIAIFMLAICILKQMIKLAITLGAIYAIIAIALGEFYEKDISFVLYPEGVLAFVFLGLGADYVVRHGKEEKHPVPSKFHKFFLDVEYRWNRFLAWIGPKRVKSFSFFVVAFIFGNLLRYAPFLEQYDNYFSMIIVFSFLGFFITSSTILLIEQPRISAFIAAVCWFQIAIASIDTQSAIPKFDIRGTLYQPGKVTLVFAFGALLLWFAKKFTNGKCSYSELTMLGPLGLVTLVVYASVFI